MIAALMLIALALQTAPSPEPSVSPSISPSPVASPIATASPTPVPLYVLTPPSGWQQMAFQDVATGQFHLLVFYVGPQGRGARPSINVLRDDLADQTETVARRADEVKRIYLQNNNVVKQSHAEKLCRGTIDGWYIESSGKFGGQNRTRVQTVLIDNGSEFVATYSRPIGTAVDPAAVKALDTLCPQPQ